MIEKWEDLPIGKSQEILKISKSSSTDIMEQSDDRMKIVSILSDIPVSKLGDMVFSEYIEISKKTAFIYTEMPETKLDMYKDITINGHEYYIFNNFAEMKTAHYIDFQKLVRNIENDMIPMLSTCIIPKGKEYNRGYDIRKVQKDIREHLSVVDAIGIYFFFVNLLKDSMQTFLTCLQQDRTLSREAREKMKVQMEKMQEILEPGGDGKPM